MSGILSGHGVLKGRGVLGGGGIIPTSGQQMRVLFFGNSFTYGEDGQADWVSVPDVFQALADAAGLSAVTGMQASPGQSFHYHLNPALASTTALLQARKWTHVVLQNKVSEASHIGWEPDFHTLGAEFYDLIQELSPAAKVRLYEGWAYGAENSKMTGVSDATHFIDPQEMLDEIAANHVTLRDTLNTANPAKPPVVIVPVGQFMRSMGAALPTDHPDYQNFWAPNQPTDDWIHGNRPWYFASGCCFFAEIYGIDPTPYAIETAAALGIDMTGYDAEEIATRAWQFISTGAYPPVILEQPEDATITEGGTGVFTVEAMGSPLAYQWRKDGVNVPGANAATFNYLSDDDEGGTAPEIDCVVSNDLGSKTSDAATLTIEDAISGPYATGGTVTETGGYRIHTFTASGNIDFEYGGDVEYLIVAGGGGGGGASGGSNSGGGGGGGGVRSGTTSVASGVLAVTVGAGGTAGTAAPANGGTGGNSSFNGITSLGGGYGAERFTNGGAGGSGGGAGALATTGGAGTAGQGFAGGNTANGQAGGGGGAGEVGEAGLAAASPFVEGCSGSAGGDGVASSISGASTTYGGGGGGGTSAAGGSGRSSFGGAGGGGKGSNGNGPTTVPQAGTNGLGGGGGGAHQGSNQAGGAGGSGVVIIRYPI